VADSPTYIQDQNLQVGLPYSGYVQSKVCPFGLCTIEIPTYAAHPGASTLYIWVTTVPIDGTNYRDVYEKPTNYLISSTIGLSNCVQISSLLPANSFCANLTTVTAGNGFWNYRNATAKVTSSNCTYQDLINRCPTPTYPCQVYLNRFACLQEFRECDGNGFQVPVCAANCQSAINVCGPWYSPYVACKETNVRYMCETSRYAAAEPCTGDVTVANSTGLYNFGLPGSTTNNLPNGGLGGPGSGSNYQTSIAPTTTPVALTPDQVEPPIGLSQSRDCFSVTPSPFPSGTVPPRPPGVSASPFATPSPHPRSSASQSSFSIVLVSLLIILSMWLAY